MKLQKLLFSVILGGLALTACDEIAENERWGEKTPIANDDEGHWSGPTPETFEKNVLIEDFTGQDCVNCPNAAEEVHHLQEQTLMSYGKQRIIAVAIHGGSMSMSADANARGLATAQGNEFNQHWGVSSWPKGMVDRTDGLCDFVHWAARAMARLSLTSPIDFNIHTTYNPETREVKIEVEGSSTSMKTTTLNVWLTENDIVGYQKMPDGSTNTKYVHNHVFRDNLTSLYGDLVEADAEGKYHQTLSYAIPMGYGKGATNEKYYCKPENMSIVVFFTDPVTGQVLHVKDAPVMVAE